LKEIILAVHQYSNGAYTILILLTLIASFLLGRITSGPFFFLVAFPGVVLHEVSHFVIAVVLRGAPEPINLAPRKSADGTWVLGSVTFYPSWWNAGFIALAPLYVLPLLGWGIYCALHDGSLAEMLLGGYLLACLAWGMHPSRADWSIALSRPLGTLVVLGGVGLALQQIGLELVAAWNG
jgi:hypothetical protein